MKNTYTPYGHISGTMNVNSQSINNNYYALKGLQRITRVNIQMT
jgi:hypothetical protein